MSSRHWDVLTRVIERIFATTSVCSYLSHYVSFAATGEKTWILMFRRIIDEERGVEMKTIYFYPVSIDVMLEVWTRLSLYGSKNPYCDATMIYTTLKTLGYVPETCRTQFATKSLSSVYLVTLPCREVNDLVIDSDQVHFAIKVMPDDTRYAKESAALTAVAGGVESAKTLHPLRPWSSSFCPDCNTHRANTTIIN